MRHIAIVGVDPGAGTVECEISDDGERVLLPLDEQLRAAARGEFVPAAESEGDAARDDSPAGTTTASTPVEPAAEAPARRTAEQVRLRPKEIQDRVRSGASVDQIVELTGFSHNRVEAYAYPILQERALRAEKARAAHPLLADGPAVDTVEAKTHAALESRGVDPELVRWDAWRLKSGNWALQASWPAGLSEDATAVWEFVADSHGGVARPLDQEAEGIGDPSRLRRLSAVSAPTNAPYGGAAGTAHRPDDAASTDVYGDGATSTRGLRAVPTHDARALPHDPTTNPEPFVIGRPVPIQHPTQPIQQPAQPTQTAGAHRGAPIEMGPGAGAAGASAAARGTRHESSADAPGTAEPTGDSTAAGHQPTSEDVDVDEQDFLRHPPADPPRAKGKHPAMPSWEDVLLGVRSPKD